MWAFGQKKIRLSGESTKVVFNLLFYPIYGIIQQATSLSEYKGAKSLKSEKIDRPTESW